MTAAGVPENREVIPRWRAFSATVRIGETATSRPKHGPAAIPDLSEPETAFKRDPGLHTAADLVGAALAAPAPNAVALEAADYLRRLHLRNSTVNDMASSLLSLNEDGDNTEEPDDSSLEFQRLRKRVRVLRRIVHSEPKNAVRWADLALAHTVLGHPHQAQRELQVALSIFGPNRFLLRAAARLYVHLELPDKAHSLLVQQPGMLDDPWIASAELATATLANLPLKFVKRARGLLADTARVAPVHLAELASQMATIELRAGRTKQAKRLMRQALVHPTDNALAQAEWASSNGLSIEPGAVSVANPYEALTIRHTSLGEWAAATSTGLSWLGDQPFDQDAALYTSYIASVGAQDWRSAALAARIGLMANPTNSMLRNNLVFALANDGDVQTARKHFRSISTAGLTDVQRAVARATEGLLFFREGDASKGRQLYSEAVEILATRQSADHAALAHVLWAREEVLAKTTIAPKILAGALKQARSNASPVSRLWADRVEDEAHRMALGGQTELPFT